MRIPAPEEAREFLSQHSFIWHQKFELAPGVWSTGDHDITHLLGRFGLPSERELRGRSVLDIGTTNGGSAFLAERAGADHVVAVDIFDAEWFGIRPLKELFSSRVEFVRASVYELPALLNEKFDVVIFLGVLYHLRHPLLAIDAVRALCRDRAIVESAICDGIDPALAGKSAAAFFRHDELSKDASNWFAPTARTMRDWFESSGFLVTNAESWPSETPMRGLIDCRVTAAEPEYRRVSYEQLLQVTTEYGRAGSALHGRPSA